MMGLIQLGPFFTICQTDFFFLFVCFKRKAEQLKLLLFVTLVAPVLSRPVVFFLIQNGCSHKKQREIRPLNQVFSPTVKAHKSRKNEQKSASCEPVTDSWCRMMGWNGTPAWKKYRRKDFPFYRMPKKAENCTCINLPQR